MAKFCIPKESIDRVRKSIQELGDNAIEKLSLMTTKQRKNLFRNNLPDASAEKLNKDFEKAVFSSKFTQLQKWVKSNLDDRYQSEYTKNNLLGKIKNLDDLNTYIDQNAENLVLQKNNISLTASEAKKFNELGKVAYEKQLKVGDDIGDIVDNFESNLDYFRAVSDLERYTEELLPSSRWKTFTKSIGRATMLASFKTPFLNIESNTLTGLGEAVVRRFSNRRLGGKVDRKTLRSYVKNANKIFKETRVDVTRMMSLDDTIEGVARTKGEKTGIPKSRVGKAYTDFIFNKTLSTPDVAFGSVHFADSANLNATRLAKGNAKKSTEIFKDSLRITPRTSEGQLVRQLGVADARLATYTNESLTARANEQIRELLNKYAAGVGDILMPFVKTPSNVIETGLDYAGLGVVKGLVKTVKGLRADGKLTRETTQSIMRDLVRSGLGMTAAYVIVSNIDSKDFMGAYDPNRVKIDQLSNGAYNAVKIGNKWVNVDYFGVLAVPIVSMLYAKKYGDTAKSRTQSYSLGAFSQFAKAPGFEPLSGVLRNIIDVDPENNERWFKYFSDRTERTVSDALAGRLIPGLVYDLAKSFDEVQRDTRQKKYILKIPFTESEFELDRFAQKIPFLRETLPEKHNALGRVMYEDGAFQSLMFGARVRTARMDSIVDEIYRLRDRGQTPNIKDLRFMNSTKVDELREKVGEERFFEITKSYGESLAVKYEEEMKKESYKSLSDEEKKEKLSSVGQKLYVKTLRDNGIKYR